MSKSHIFRLLLLIMPCGVEVTDAEPKFSFESIETLDDMTSLIRSEIPLGSSRAHVRRIFIEEWLATMKVKDNDPQIEKYIYDIDLCQYYIWRWNISADYDTNDQLLQAYVNGNIVFPDGNTKKSIPMNAHPGENASIYRMQRPRPEAYKGETSLGFLLFDRDSDMNTTDDQALIGAGPSRVNPTNMGKMTVYKDIDPWRSIFDFDVTDRINPYQGNCDAEI